MDAADAFWAASIVARFTDPMIKSIVEVARLSDPNASAYLADVIIRRRDKVVAHWLTGTNPLDRFAIAQNADGAAVTFDHAAIRLGVANNTAKYIVNFLTLDNMTGTESAHDTAAATKDRAFTIPAQAWGPRDAAGFRYVIASIRTLQEGYPQWAQPVRVTLRERGATVEVVAIDRRAGETAVRGTN